MIRKLANGQCRLYSRKVDPKPGKRHHLGMLSSRAGAEKHERADGPYGTMAVRRTG